MSLIAAADGFVPPGPGDFVFPGLIGGFTKTMLIIVLGAVVVAVFYLLSSRKAAVVPSRLQFAGESVYGFVRNTVALEAIGGQGMKFVPYLATLFSFIAVLNVAGIIPVLQFPATSRIAIPLFLAVISCVLFNYQGIRRAGFVGYFREMMFPAGVPWLVYFLLAPIEFLSTVVIRPLTLTLRLTLNMFAGHLVLLVFVLGGKYLLIDYGGVVGIGGGAVTLVGSIILTFFEGFIQLLQAYVFTLLTALYIGGALLDEH